MEYFADGSGLGALGLNWQSFLFQLISFVLVLLILRQFAYKKLIGMLEARRQTVEGSLAHAAQTEAKMREAETKIAAMLDKARVQADAIVSAGHAQAASLLKAAEAKAADNVTQIVAEAQVQLQSEVSKARAQLRREMASLVSAATAKIIKAKLDGPKDNDLITDAIASAKGAWHE